MDQKEWAAIILVVLAMFLVTTTLPRGLHGVLFPSLVQVSGVPALVIFVAAQAGLCLLFRAEKGVAWMAAGLAVGFPVGWVVHILGPGAVLGHGTWPRDGVCAAACTSAFCLALAFWKQKV